MWAKQVGEAGLRRRLGLDGDLRTWGNLAHPLDDDKGDGTVEWSTVAGVARPPRVVFLRGDWSEVQRRKWRGPRALCFHGGDCVAALRGPVSVVSLRQVVGGVAATRWRWTPHSGGPPGAVWSASFGSLSTRVTSGFSVTT